MAVVSRNGNTNQNSGNQQDQGFKILDPFAKDLKAGVKTVVDTKDDAWSRSAPPDAGYYDLKLFLGRDGFKGHERQQDPDNPFYEANLECRIVAPNSPEIDNFPVLTKVNTYIGRGKKISKMGGLYLLMGGKKLESGAEICDRDMLQLFAKKLKGEPIIRGVHCDWSGWSQKNQSMVFNSQEDFGEDEEGLPRHTVTITAKDGTTETINASLKVKNWPNVEEYLAGKIPGQGKGGNKKVVQAGDDDDDLPVVSNVAPPVAQPVTAAAVAAGATETPARKKKRSQAAIGVTVATPPPPPVVAVATVDEDDEDEDDEKEDLSEFEDDED